MNDMIMQLVGSVAGVLVLLGIIALLITWLIFPWMVCSRLDRINRTLVRIEKAPPLPPQDAQPPATDVARAMRDALGK